MKPTLTNYFEFLNEKAKYHFLLIPIFLASCISVDLKSGRKLAENYEFSEPEKPFQEEKTLDFDHVWLNSKNGNTISILTECNEETGQALKSIRKDTIPSLDSSKIISEDFIDLNGHTALRSDIEGALDGTKVNLRMITLAHEKCSYNLTLILIALKDPQDLKTFDKFYRNFEVE